MTPAKQRALVTVLIGLGLLIVGVFGVRTLHALKEFRGHQPPHPPFKNEQPATDVELIRDWMTIPMIGKMYRVPPPVIFSALNISPTGNDKRNLKELNDRYFPNASGYVLKVVKAAVQANMPPTPVAANTAIAPSTAVPVPTAVLPISP